MKSLRLALAACLALSATAFACGTADPRLRILEERARWNVTLRSWAQSEQDGSITLDTRLSGPVNSDLEKLTVRFVLQGAGGATLGHEWRTFDLSGIERGGPEDLLLRLGPRETVVEGIGLDPVAAPQPDDIPHIQELQLR